MIFLLRPIEDIVKIFLKMAFKIFLAHIEIMPTDGIIIYSFIKFCPVIYIFVFPLIPFKLFYLI